MLNRIKKFNFSIAAVCMQENKCDWQRLGELITVSDDDWGEVVKRREELKTIASRIQDEMKKFNERKCLNTVNLARTIKHLLIKENQKLDNVEKRVS